MTDRPRPRIVGIGGSLRDRSATWIALQRALLAAESAGAKTDAIDLRDLDLDLFDPDEDEGPAAAEMTAAIRAADGVIIATPMYHGSYSSAIKNAIDYCGFDEFEHKTVALLCVAGGRYPISAMDHLRTVFRALDAWVLPYQAAIPQASRTVEDGRIVDDELRTRVETLGERLVKYAPIDKTDPRCFESLENIGAAD